MSWIRVAVAAFGLGLTSGARAAEGDVPDLRQALSSEAAINWTTLTIEITTSAWGRGVGAATKALEARAREGIPAKVAAASRRVPVHGDVTVSDLLQDPSLNTAINGRVERWVVTEARYFTSGRVELLAELPLQELLKPWALQRAPLSPDPQRSTRFTGLLVDARGLSVTPAYAPRLLAESGEELWSGRVWDDVVLFQTPVVYVPDPAHPASARAGLQPLVVRAVETRGPDLVLAETDRVRFRTALGDARAVGEGTVVVVIDP